MSFYKRNLTEEIKNTLAEVYNGHLIEREEAIRDTAFLHNFRMTEDEESMLQGCFPRRTVLSIPTLDSSHPVLAALNTYANKHAEDAIRKAMKHGKRVMTIGDAAHRPLGAHHNCLLDDNLREHHRIVGNKRVNRELYNHAHRGTPTYECVRGSEKCDFAAHEAFAVHSTYDISMENIARIFDRHGLHKMTVYMYIPTELYGKDYKSPWKFFGVDKRTESREEVMLFSMHDYSIPYVHNVATWQAWAMTTLIRCTDYAITIEHIGDHGPLHIISLYRVDYKSRCALTSLLRGTNERLYRTVPLGRLFNDAYRVPDLVHAIANSFLTKQEETPHFITPGNIVLALLSYANRTADDGYKFHELATYASGLRRSIVIGGKTYQGEWECDAETYYRTILSLFIIGAAQRTNRTRAITSVFKHFKDTQMHSGFFGDIWHNVKRYFHTIQDVDINAMGDRIWEFSAIPITNITVAGVHNVYTMNPSLDLPTQSNWQQEWKINDDMGATHQDVETDDNMPSSFKQANSMGPTHQDVDEDCTSEKSDDSSTGSSDQNCSIAAIIDKHTMAMRSILHKRRRERSLQIQTKEKASVIPVNKPLPIIPVCDRLGGSFLPGHCALQAFYDSMARTNYYPAKSIAEFLRDSYNIMIASMQNHYTLVELNDYFLFGKWDSNVSTWVIDNLSEAFDTTTTLYQPVIGPMVLRIGRDPRNHIDIAYANNHYTVATQRGGAKGKFTTICSNLSFEGKRVCEMSAAPGHLAKLLSLTVQDFTPFYYSKGLPIGQDYHQSWGLLDTRKIAFTPYANYHELDQIMGQYDFIICDAAAPINTEVISNSMAKIAVKHLQQFGSFLIKTFGNCYDIWRLVSSFSDCTLHYANPDESSERYFLFTGFGQKPTKTFEQMCELYGQRETIHKLPQVDFKLFIRRYFTGEFKRFAPIAPKCPKSVTIRCVTGFAGASKTTGLIKKYPNAVMVAPTKVLALKHQRLGVRSFTQHAIFKIKLKSTEDVIIVDELSQFPFEYFVLLKCCFPDRTIIATGDIYQTPAFAGVSEIKTLADFGVVNNILESFTMPQDVTDDVSRNFGLPVKTHSNVACGYIRYLGDIFAFAKSKIPVLCFNDNTAKELNARGLNAYTITTYTGSRNHTVVFYIDSAAVASQMNNKPEYSYVAVSRATHQIVIAGDSAYISKRYTISGSKISTFEEINRVYVNHFIKIDEIKLDTTVEQGVATTPAALDTVIETCTNNIVAVNDRHGEFQSIRKAEIPEVGSGSLTTPTDSVLDVPQTQRVYRLVRTKLVESQLSSNRLETLQTLIGRYAMKYKHKMTPRNHKFVYSDLMTGLSRALYGNDHSLNKLKSDMAVDGEYLSIRAMQYLQKLQTKVNANSAALNDIKEGFDWFRENLSFFNKRQTKYKTDLGFDMSDKVGQGVAATSKRLNLLFGCYARAMLDRIREILVANKRPIMLSTHSSEAELNDEYVARATDLIDEKTQWCCNDFSQWDASFRTPFVGVTLQLLRWMGCPEELVENFKRFRDKWTMIYHHKFGTTKLRGQEKQFSGNPFTICENTLCNMALCFSILQYKDMRFAMFKGDDSAVLASGSRLTEKGKKIIELTGHGLKLHQFPYGEFAGWFLTKEGFFPDVLRYTVKFIGKDYRDQEHFDEALLSLQERTTTVKNQRQLNVGIQVATHYYQSLFGSNSISAQEVENLYSFLRNSRSIQFTDLQPIDLPLIKV